jgi:integrase/recombinase XerD
MDEEERNQKLVARGVRKIRESGLASDHPLFEQALAFIQGMPSAATTQIYGYNIGSWFTWCVTQAIDPIDASKFEAKAYVASLGRYAPMSRAQRISSLRSFYEDLVDEGLAPRDPFRRVVPPAGDPINETPALSFEEFRHLLAVVRGHYGDPTRDLCARRDFAMMFLMGRLGLRSVEVSRLLRSDLISPEERSTVRVHGKGDKWAVLHVPPDVVEVVEAWRGQLARAYGAVPQSLSPMFPVLRRGRLEEGIELRPLAPSTIGGVVKKRMLDAGFDGPRFRAHALRATAATIAHDNGADLLAIARMLRHANARTTQGYIKRHEGRRTSAADTWRGPDFGAA